jgi:arginyl-tRNA synthetase
MINFSEGSVAYLEYVHVRILGILKKLNQNASGGDSQVIIDSDEEFQLIKRLAEFPKIIEKSGKFFAPHYIARYLGDLAKEFNTFYDKINIIKSSNNLIPFRIRLIKAVDQVLLNGFRILNIPIVDQM